MIESFAWVLLACCMFGAGARWQWERDQSIYAEFGDRTLALAESPLIAELCAAQDVRDQAAERAALRLALKKHADAEVYAAITIYRARHP